jgi:hypothetical protein
MGERRRNRRALEGASSLDNRWLPRGRNEYALRILAILVCRCLRNG